MTHPSGIAYPFIFSPAGGVGKAGGSSKVAANLKCLVKTAVNERVIRKKIGTIGYQQVFRSSGFGGLDIIEALVTEALAVNEPRVTVLSVNVYQRDIESGSAVFADIAYIFKGSGEVDTVSTQIS